MFCKVCGTVNKEGAEVCIKCAQDLHNPIMPEQTLTQMSIRLGPENTEMGQGLGGLTRTTRIILYVTFAAVVIIIPVFFIASSMNAENAKGGIAKKLNEGGTPISLEGYEPDDGVVLEGDVARINNAKQIQQAVEVHLSDFGSYPMSLAEIAERLNFDADPDIYDYYQLENEYQYELRTRLEGLGVGLNSSNIVSEGGVYYHVVGEGP